MKVTRYFQSCLLIEGGDGRILVDPSGQEKDRDFGKLDAVLYTHEHGDHFEAELAEKLKAGAPVYANASTAKQMKSEPNIVSDGDEFEVEGMKVKVIELPHCLMPDGSEGPQNVGYLINEKLFHPGDGKEHEGLVVENLALPITGPDVSMKDCLAFAKQVQAKTVVPIHYDNFGAKPETYERLAGMFGFDFKFHTLGLGESSEL